MPADRTAAVSRFFVAPGARGRGIGSALTGAAEDHAAAHDLGLLDDGHSVLPVLLFVLPDSLR